MFLSCGLLPTGYWRPALLAGQWPKAMSLAVHGFIYPILSHNALPDLGGSDWLRVYSLCHTLKAYSACLFTKPCVLACGGSHLGWALPSLQLLLWAIAQVFRHQVCQIAPHSVQITVSYFS